ncbi:MAG: TIGR03621 family F420-dependent LLM class oxidoreductase [Acidimicrobiia bacterium]
MHPFRFGVQLAEASSGRDWADQARKLEDLGYSTLFMPDHYDDTMLSPMPALAAAAAATDTLRVGTLVLGNDYRHPAEVAKEAATVDLLSDGRLELGLGAGWMIADYEELGLDYDRAGVRIDRLAEAIQVVKGAWSPGPFSFTGDHYTIADYDATPEPVQEPHPPLLIGGGGKRVLSLAAREADIIGVNPSLAAGAVDPTIMDDALADATTVKIGWVRDAAGDRFDDIELQVRYFLAAVTDDARGYAEAIAAGFGVDIDPETALASSLALVGSVDEIVDRCYERREEWGFSYIVVGGDEIESFAPVVERLAGQ